MIFPSSKEKQQQNDNNNNTEQEHSDTHHAQKSNDDDSMCVFILATPGSGSSTMVDLVGTCRPNPPPDPPAFLQQEQPLPLEAFRSSCFISGENMGIFQELQHVDTKLKQTEKHYRGTPTAHGKAAWKMYFGLAQAQSKMKELATTILNPYNSTCWGFKEIRHGRSEHISFAQEIEFLKSLCPNPKIILHSRKEYQKEFQSSIIRHAGTVGEQSSLQQRLCFDTYMGMELNQTIVQTLPKNPKRKKSTYSFCSRANPQQQRKQQQSHRQQNLNEFVFRHFLEDYIERNDRFQTLWKDFLKCTGEPPLVCQGDKGCKQQNNSTLKNSP